MTTDLGGWIVSDTGYAASGPLTVTAGPGCTSLDAQIAFCEHNVEDVTETPFHVLLVLGDSVDLGPGVGVVGERAWASDACGPFRPGDDLPCQGRISAGDGVDLVFANDVGEPWFVGDEPSVIYGGPGRDFLHAGEAGSRLLGQRGDDELIGGPGKDMISGGGGEDTIRGGLRRDELRGQAGADPFYARDGYRDRLFGGKGRDRARLDRRLDRLRSMERFF